MAEFEDKAGWRTLWFLIDRQRTRLALAFAFTLVAATMELVPFWLLAQGAQAVLGFIDQQSTTTEMAETFYQLALWMAAALVLKTLIYGIAYFLSHQAAFFTLAHTRRILVTRLAWAPLHWIQSYHSGQLKQMVLQDVDKIENLIAHHTVEVSVSLLTPLLITFYLFWIDWRLAVAALLVAPLAIICSMLFMRDMDSMQDQYHQVAVSLNKTTVEYLRNIPVMKLFRQDARRFSAMVQHSQHYYSLVEALTRLTVPRWALFTSLLGANMLLVLPAGGFLLLHNEIALTDLILAILLCGGMLRPLLKISHFFTDSREVLASVRRLNPVLNADNSAEHAQQAEGADPVSSREEGIDVELSRVRFSYDKTLIIPEMDLTLPAGSTTVMTGASGSGKSTLAQLIAGLLMPEQGQVTINGRAVTDLSNEQRASLVAVATQDAFLFKGTIRDNLMLARDTVQEHDMELAIKVAQAEHLIQQLPDGYDTRVNEQGTRLSGGERQRLALARALLADTPVLVLDEATAFADNLTQQAFYRDLQEHYPDKTVLIIAHRLAGMEFADQIIVLHKGHIQDAGSHTELIQRNAYYQKIWQLQRDSHHWTLQDDQACESRKRSDVTEGETTCLQI
ncbi:ABC transporter ATP-binding protein [Oceanospirillum sediminis]|uniref:ABC transporter ATP-binding protein n=1 Tax=Oceanospirillum sediminis TaxID=2760088 RepID=A0A839INA1_9GAMM|nr:ABC transporter ATP-binding protein [Oceanospirillum sediminis]MBB1485766.1 ABC transporter ATP-binding protein [Oceanospirillum sediminis]